MSPEKIEIRKFKLKATISSQLLFSQSCALVEKFVKINNKPGTAQVGAISKAQKDSKTKTTFSTTGDNKSSQKTFRIFFRNFFEVSGKSHSAEKCKRGDALGFFEHPFCCKISKIVGRNNEKISEKKSVSQCRKKEESLIVSKKVDPSALEWLFISC